ncbi:hypothetical protein BCT63_05790 [Vibrio kanaloae]|uniref:hypothetical protein n=1 Tax=Vibrio kanaloae TaxID=170673 RepID=UPI000C82BF0E|nr:hypothetical protein [Vibrio kanaloae]PMM06842.1 hypothetical protein BCT63_05790 [Vibrio kanaloae]
MKVEILKEINNASGEAMGFEKQCVVSVDYQSSEYNFEVTVGRLEANNYELQITIDLYNDLKKEDQDSVTKLISDYIEEDSRFESKKYTPFSKMTNKQKNIVNTVFQELKDRDLNPSGEFDNQGRWYADNRHLINCRTPSRSFPYSEMQACRAKKYVAKVLEFYGCKSAKTLRKKV